MTGLWLVLIRHITAGAHRRRPAAYRSSRDIAMRSLRREDNRLLGIER